MGPAFLIASSYFFLSVGERSAGAGADLEFVVNGDAPSLAQPERRIKPSKRPGAKDRLKGVDIVSFVSIG